MPDFAVIKQLLVYVLHKNEQENPLLVVQHCKLRRTVSELHVELLIYILLKKDKCRGIFFIANVTVSAYVDKI